MTQIRTVFRCVMDTDPEEDVEVVDEIAVTFDTAFSMVGHPFSIMRGGVEFRATGDFSWNAREGSYEMTYREVSDSDG